MRQLKITTSITTRESASFNKYLSEVGQLPLISAEEEVKLAQRIRAGDEEALQQLVSANLRFVISVAKKYQAHGMSLPDLVNEGNLGLMKAAKRFDEKRGFKFISYAVWWIRQSIIQAISEHSRTIRLPLNKISLISKMRKAFIELEQKHNREPTDEELAEFMDVPEYQIEETKRASPYTVSVDAPVGGDPENRNLVDTLVKPDSQKPDHSLMSESLRTEINQALDTLTSRESSILEMLFGINNNHSMSLGEIAEEVGLTRERVRQIKEKAIRKLRQSRRSALLRKYLGD